MAFKSIGLRKIPIKDITFDEVALRGAQKKDDNWPNFVASIRNNGVMLPVVVRIHKQGTKDAQGNDVSGKFCVVDGCQRTEAAIEAGLEEIPANIVEVDTAEDVMFAQIQGNFSRFNTRPADLAQQLRRIMVDNPSISIQELADGCRQSATWVQKMLTLNFLPEEAKQLVNSGQISAVNAYQLGSLAKLNKEEVEAGDWVARASTEDPDTFAADVARRKKELNKKVKPRDEGEWVPPPTLRTRKEVEAYWLSVFSEYIEGKDIEIPEQLDFEQPNVAITAYQVFSWVLQQDPETIKAKQEERRANVARRNAEKGIDTNADLSERAAKAGLSKMVKGPTVPTGF